jgi:predicted RNase H-like HicB family nuclease
MMANSKEISLPVSIFKEGDSFVAYTPALDISTCADTQDKVMANFDELVRIFFEELERNNNVDEVLSSLGWQKINKVWAAPEEVSHSIKKYQVLAT